MDKHHGRDESTAFVSKGNLLTFVATYSGSHRVARDHDNGADWAVLGDQAGSGTTNYKLESSHEEFTCCILTLLSKPGWHQHSVLGWH